MRSHKSRKISKITQNYTIFVIFVEILEHFGNFFCGSCSKFCISTQKKLKGTECLVSVLSHSAKPFWSYINFFSFFCKF